MKKILFVIGLLVSIIGFSQLPTISGVTNINQKYQWYEGYFHNKFRVPKDTSAIADTGMIAWKLDNFYFNFGQWQSMQRSILTDPQNGDLITYNNGYFINQHPLPSACNNSSQVPFSWISDTTYAIGAGPYTINCIQYTTTNKTLLLRGGNTTVDSARTDAVVLRANDVVAVIQGDNYALGQVATPTIDPANEILLSYVTFTGSNTTPDQVSQTIMYKDHAGGEWTFSTFGTVTADPDQTTIKYEGTKAISITAAANNSGYRLQTTDSLSQNDYSIISGWIYNSSVFNNNRNWIVRLLWNGVQVAGSNTVTLTTNNGYNKATTGIWQLWRISMPSFGGNYLFNGIEIRNTGTGGTVNVKHDFITGQNGITIITNSDAPQNLQKTLDVGSTLTRTNIIDQKGNPLIFTNSKLNINSLQSKQGLVVGVDSSSSGNAVIGIHATSGINGVIESYNTASISIKAQSLIELNPNTSTTSGSFGIYPVNGQYAEIVGAASGLSSPRIKIGYNNDGVKDYAYIQPIDVGGGTYMQYYANLIPDCTGCDSIVYIDNGIMTKGVAPGGGLGNVTGQASSVDGEVALFSGTTGKVIKRMTGSGIVKVASGVASTATSGTDYVTPSGTETISNKRWVARVGSTTSSATPTINTDNVDIYKLTAQAVDITSFTTNLSGTPNDGDILQIQITGTAARAITWGSSFVSGSVTLPSTTVTTTTLTVLFQYYTTSSYGNNKWVCKNVD